MKLLTGQITEESENQEGNNYWDLGKMRLAMSSM